MISCRTLTAYVLLVWLFPCVEVSATEPIFLDKSLSQWREQLQSDFSTSRLLAVEAMGRLGVSALDDLRQTLHHREEAVRVWAARGLANVEMVNSLPEAQRQVTIKSLHKATQGRSPSVRIAAAGSLAALGEKQIALDTLSVAIKHPVDSIRIAAAGELAKLGPIAASVLRKAASDNNKYVVRISSRALAAFNEAE